jgi:hypothetical protein
MAHINAGCPQTVRTSTNELGLTKESALGSTSWWSIASTPLPTECTSVSRWSSSQMQFCEWLQPQHTADDLFVRNIFWTGEACFTCEGVFNINSNHLWAQDNSYAICECQYQVRFSVSIWAGFIRDIVMGPYLLPERLTAQWYHDFLETVLLELLQDVPLAMRQRLWFLHETTPVHYGEDDWQWGWTQQFPGRRTGCQGLTSWPSWSPDLTRKDTWTSMLMQSLPGDCQRSPGKPSSSCDNSWWWHVKACLRERCAAHCHLPWNGQGLLQTPTITMWCPWSIDSLCHMMVTCILKTEVRGHAFYTISTCFFFNKELHYGVPVCEFRFTLYVRVCTCACMHVCVVCAA